LPGEGTPAHSHTRRACMCAYLYGYEGGKDISKGRADERKQQEGKQFLPFGMKVERKVRRKL